MAFGISDYEFPHSHNYDSDLREVLFHLKKLRDWCYKLQQAVDDHDTRIEYLEGIIASIKEEMDTLRATIYAYIDTTVDVALQKMQKQLDEDLNSFKEYFDEQIQNMLDTVNSLNKYFLNQMWAYYRSLVHDIANVQGYCEHQLAEMQAEIDELKQDVGNEIWNPIDGMITSKNHMMVETWEHSRVHAVKNWEYECYGWTNDERDRHKILNWHWDEYSRDELNHWWWFTTLNPYTGTWQTKGNVASWIATEGSHTAITNALWEQMGLDNDTYDEKGLTAREYQFTRWYGEYLFTDADLDKGAASIDGYMYVSD